MLLALFLILAQDPTEQLRRQELALRLSELADAENLDGFARAVQRELRAPRVDGSLFDQCWHPVSQRRWEGRLEALIAAWDRTAEAPTPGRLLFRAKLEELASRTKGFRERLEDAVRKFPGEPVLLWTLGKARFDAGDRGAAALALEEAAGVKGAIRDPDEFHRLLVICYAETGRPAAAVEHLRAMRREEENAVERARLAARAKLPEEAARLYRLALQEEPDRISLRMGLVVALNAAGERAQAAAERARLFIVDGKFSPSKMEDYFFLLPPDGRAEEIVRTLRDQPPPALLPCLGSVPPECRTSVLGEWEKTTRDGRDWAMLSRMKGLWATEEARVDILTKGEARFPRDPWIVREKIEALDRSQQYKEVWDAYNKLTELDPAGTITGPRPFVSLSRALADLSLKNVAAAIPMAFRLLSEPGLDEASARVVRAALKPGWELSAGEFWDQLKKARLPRPDAEGERALKTSIEKLSSDEFAVRTEASAELRKGGLPAIAVLLERVDDPDAEIRSRVRDVIRSILIE
jgi:tetratricopeptide (TPR) repeat protein